jgi:hypothetical protein
VGWAVLVGLAAVLIGTSRWRWLVLAHPVLTMLVVVVTANHWWLDGAVAVVLLALAAGLHVGVRRGVARWRPGQSVLDLSVPDLSVPDRPAPDDEPDVVGGVGGGAPGAVPAGALAASR